MTKYMFIIRDEKVPMSTTNDTTKWNILVLGLLDILGFLIGLARLFLVRAGL